MTTNETTTETTETTESAAPPQESQQQESQQQTGQPAAAPAQTMASLMAEHEEEAFQKIKRGQLLTGKVVQINEDNVLVDVGYKTEGVVPMSQLTHRRDLTPGDVVSVGEEISVVVRKVDDSEGTVILSKKQADLESAWIKVNEAFEKGEVLTATCTEQVKGGLIVDLGLRGFVPASHVDLRPVHDLSDYVGESLQLKVLEIDKPRRKIVLSRKQALEEERSREKDKTMADLEEGQIVSGTVARLTNFGAFVNLGGVDGLVHISELAWKRIKHPSEVVRVGEAVDVRVLSVNRDKERISLSLKQARPDPWSGVDERFRENSVVKGRVSKLAKNYAFVEIDDGVEGLVPLSELSEYRVARPSEVLKVDQEVKVKVLEVKPEQRRILLSIRQGEGGGGSIPASATTGGQFGSTIGDRLPDSIKEMLAQSGDENGSEAEVNN